VPIAPLLVDGGERLFDNLDGGLMGYECVVLVARPPSRWLAPLVCGEPGRDTHRPMSDRERSDGLPGPARPMQPEYSE
jgi:hypothetical protein